MISDSAWQVKKWMETICPFLNIFNISSRGRKYFDKRRSKKKLNQFYLAFIGQFIARGTFTWPISSLIYEKKCWNQKYIKKIQRIVSPGQTLLVSFIIYTFSGKNRLGCSVNSYFKHSTIRTSLIFHLFYLTSHRTKTLEYH